MNGYVLDKKQLIKFCDDLDPVIFLNKHAGMLLSDGEPNRHFQHV